MHTCSATTKVLGMGTQRTSTYEGQTICLSGASTKVLVWINDKPVLGIAYRFKSLRAAKAAAVSYIIRHKA